MTPSVNTCIHGVERLSSLRGSMATVATTSVASCKTIKTAYLRKRRSALIFVIAISPVTCLLHYHSFAYLCFRLTDNRHYTIHVWRRLLGRIPGLKEALLPRLYVLDLNRPPEPDSGTVRISVSCLVRGHHVGARSALGASLLENCCRDGACPRAGADLGLRTSHIYEA